MQVNARHSLGTIFRKVSPYVWELHEPLDHKEGDESFTKAVQFGQRMMQAGFVGKHVRNEAGRAVVRFFKP